MTEERPDSGVNCVREQGIDTLIARIAQACQTRALRLTPLRQEVLRLVLESDRPVKAYDILERISESSAINAPPTVYRSLDFLLDNGFIHKLESINAFAACVCPDRVHVGAFLICDQCLSASEAEIRGIGALLQRGTDGASFRPYPRTQTVEVHGLCATCGAISKDPDGRERRRRPRSLQSID